MYSNCHPGDIILKYHQDEQYQFKVEVHIDRYDFKISSPNNVTDLGTYKAGSSLSVNSNQYVYIILEE